MENFSQIYIFFSSYNEKEKTSYVSSKRYIHNTPLTLQIVPERDIFLFCTLCISPL